MSVLPERREQIRSAHAALILQVVAACQNPQLRGAVDDHLRVAAANGWGELVSVIQQIMAGKRELGLLQGLDEEDSVIVESILMGLQNPETLPKSAGQADPGLAAPGLASVILAARRGDPQAVAWLGQMASQMQKAGGDMARMGAALGPLSRGLDDRRKLEKGMGPLGRSLLQGVLDELAKAELQ
ncbi:hypothetical protein [Acidithiobacillus concretivorus]|uniref:DUF1641 domain-containing protein n=1 Tax=Acidithiobacillus concretivorus TaxID=3063952 RepID=A0ABS5ZT10_9PROT|nr:hypothetical protein [Acidithiobacillus concretivorus]MBU2739640.1 hypothetical protein [Acidithiobacillus concretivorus]